MGGSGKEFRTRPNGEPFIIDFTAVNYDPWRRDHEMLQQYWKEIGIDVQMRTADGGAYWSMYGGQQIEATINWSAEPEPTDRGIYLAPGAGGAGLGHLGVNQRRARRGAAAVGAGRVHGP